MAAKTAKGNQGKRYSAEDKAEIIKFIQAYNAENKRGGMKAASDKFGVSVVTLSNWGKSSKKKKTTRAKAKRTVKAKAKAKAKVIPQIKTVPESADAILKRLQAIRGEIAVLGKEFNALKKKL